MRSSDLLDPVVRLRVLITSTGDPGLREELRGVERSLNRQIGLAVPKRDAATLLGVSVTALDRYIDSGVLPAVASDTGRRLAVEAAPLLELATVVRRLRAQGRTRGVVSEATRRLGWRPRGARLVYAPELARLPRPNVSVAELEQHYRETTPADRLRELVGLNASAAMFAGKGLP